MNTNVKRLIYITLAVIVGVTTYWYFGSRGTPPVAISPELKITLEKERPVLVVKEKEYFDLLLQNAVSGGPPKDGIPSIDNPKYESALEANDWLLPHDVVFGVVAKDFVAAYPQRILVWHEIVNEKINGQQVSITYCPLTGTAIGFKGEYAPDISAEFGVSGKLVNSNLIMYDRTSDSLWPQILGKAISGPARGIALPEFPVVWTTWEKWKAKYPQTKVLSKETDFLRNYGARGDPYGSYLEADSGYYKSDHVIFALTNEDKRLPPKTVVVGLRDNQGNAVAILKDYLRREKRVEVDLGGQKIVVEYDASLDFYTTSPMVNAFDAMWFAWSAFYPNTQLIK